MERHLLIVGLGYSGSAVARAALRAGWRVSGTSRTPERIMLPGVQVLPFEQLAASLPEATHLLATAAPGDDGDPVLVRYADAVHAADRLRWIGYLSATGVYGDRGGAWVDENTPPQPGSDRARRRLAAELAWHGLERRLDLFRLAGIYGPGRSAFDDLRAGRARMVDKPGQFFGRIHRDDIAAAVLAAIGQDGGGTRVLNLSDDEPAPSLAVIQEAARLLGVPAPPATPFAEAFPTMSAMARSFWAENRRVDSRQTKTMLELNWRHPTYREGLRAILAEERGELGAEQG